MPTKKHNMKNKIKEKDVRNTKKVNCSPKPKNQLNAFTCYTTASLRLLKQKWNARHPDSLITSDNAREIHTKLGHYLRNVCQTESCWMTKMGVGGDLKHDFAPVSPSTWKQNPNEWLSSVDINKVMKQYERAYKCFEFIGPSPVDFDTRLENGECVWDELCTFDINRQIQRKKTKIGISFNTDTHDKSGQHWISMFINIPKRRIFYFDSVGDKMPKQIEAFVKRIQEQTKNQEQTSKEPTGQWGPFKFDSNEGVEHQFKNTECGMYSLFFIIHMLEDAISGTKIKTHVFDDAYMEQYRHIYFNKSLDE